MCFANVLLRRRVLPRLPGEGGAGSAADAGGGAQEARGGGEEAAGGDGPQAEADRGGGEDEGEALFSGQSPLTPPLDTRVPPYPPVDTRVPPLPPVDTRVPESPVHRDQCVFCCCCCSSFLCCFFFAIFNFSGPAFPCVVIGPIQLFYL